MLKNVVESTFRITTPFQELFVSFYFFFIDVAAEDRVLRTPCCERPQMSRPADKQIQANQSETHVELWSQASVVRALRNYTLSTRLSSHVSAIDNKSRQTMHATLVDGVVRELKKGSFSVNTKRIYFFWSRQGMPVVGGNGDAMFDVRQDGIITRRCRCMISCPANMQIFLRKLITN